MEDKRPPHIKVLAAKEASASEEWFDCWDDDGFYPERSSQPRELLLLWAAVWCETQLYNGGFHQFFSAGYTGVLAPEAAEGLAMLGFDKPADVCLRAMALLGTPYPRDYELRTKRLKAFEPENLDEDCDRDDWDPFNPLDREFEDHLGEQFTPVADRFVERYL